MHLLQGHRELACRVQSEMGQDGKPLPENDSRPRFRPRFAVQTGVELPGQAFDTEWLGTDAYEVTYTVDCPAFADRVAGRLGGPGHLGRSDGTRIPGHAVASAG
jgi:hypothetical protein